MHRLLCVFGIALISFSARAENKLFPTDLLSPGQVDANFGIEHQHTRNEFYVANLTGTDSFNATAELARVRAGILANLQVFGSVSYSPQATFHSDFANVSRTQESISKKLGNPTIGLNYGLVNGSGKPFSLNIDFSVTPNVANHASTTYSAGFTGSYRLAESFNSYASYAHEYVPANSFFKNVDKFSVGAYQTLTGTLTATASANFMVQPSIPTNGAGTGSGQSSEKIWRTDVGLQYEAFRNTYFIPMVGLSGTSSLRSNNGVFTEGASHGYSAAITIYHLFN